MSLQCCVPAPGGLTVLDATPTAGPSAPLAHVSTPGIPVFDLGVPLGRRPGLRHSIEHDVVLGARKRYVEGQAVGTVPRSRCWAGATLTAWPSAQRHVSISGSLRYGYGRRNLCYADGFLTRRRVPGYVPTAPIKGHRRSSWQSTPNRFHVLAHA
jgi:hypothetical protein